MKLSPDTLFSTYSITAQDRVSGNLGVAVQTHQMSVGSVVPWALPGVGVLATQSISNINFGPMGLALLDEGTPAPQAIAALVASDSQAGVRQVAAVDSQGRVGAWTGENCIPYAGHYIGEGYSVQANMMTGPRVVEAMAEAFEGTQAGFPTRLLAAMQAAQAAGGDIRGMQSAAMVIVDAQPRNPDRLRIRRPLYDLRVDEHPEPLEALARLTRLRTAQHLNRRGDEAIRRGEWEDGLKTWAEARALAPELEELAFWQAVSLADDLDQVEAAVEILAPMLSVDDRRVHWIDLISRLQDCGLLERPGAGDDLLVALDQDTE